MAKSIVLHRAPTSTSRSAAAILTGTDLLDTSRHVTAGCVHRCTSDRTDWVGMRAVRSHVEISQRRWPGRLLLVDDSEQLPCAGHPFELVGAESLELRGLSGD